VSQPLVAVVQLSPLDGSERDDLVAGLSEELCESSTLTTKIHET
jgi:hypothetical protein